MPVTIHHPDSSAEYKTQLNGLVGEVFGFTFERWFERGLWTDDYTGYSIVEDGRMIAHAAAYRMDLMVQGRKVEAYQIGSVATRAERRGEGLSRQVIEFILAHRPGAPFFLFPNETVMDFYPRFGFHLLRDRQPRIQAYLDNPPGSMRRLDVDDPAVGCYLHSRACYSRILDCANAAPIQWFHLLYAYPENIYELPALGALLVARQTGDTLELVDLFASRPLAFTDLFPQLDFSGVHEIRFGFNPDWLGLGCEWVENEDSPIFVIGEWSLREAFIFPRMLKT